MKVLNLNEVLIIAYKSLIVFDESDGHYFESLNIGNRSPYGPMRLLTLLQAQLTHFAPDFRLHLTGFFTRRVARRQTVAGKLAWV